MYNYNKLIVEEKNSIATVTLHTPGEPHNFVGDEMINEILDFFTRVVRRLDIRVVILTGAGGTAPGRYFSVGGRISRDAEALRSEAVSNPRAHISQEVFHQRRCRVILECDKPVIAAINGPVAGAGFDLACACDFRIVVEHARLANAYIRRGLIPSASLYLLPRLVGMSWARRLVFTGEVIDAKKALEIGLVDEVVPADRFESKVQEWAHMLATKPPQAMAAAKRIMNQNMLIDDMHEGLTWLYADFFARYHQDTVEADRAFLEKREPKFEGK